MFSILDTRLKNENYALYKEFDKMSIFKTKNNDLVRYSLSNRGNALYFQKIIIHKIFRIGSVPYWDTSNVSLFNTKSTLTFGTSFQYKYALITTLNQLKRNVSDTMYGNDSASIGSFKNLYYKSSFNGVSYPLKRYSEPKKTRGIINRNAEFLGGIAAHGSYLYTAYVQSAFTLAKMKGGFLESFFNFGFNSSLFNSVFNSRFRDKILTNVTNYAFFIRTMWYGLSLKFSDFEKPFSHIEHEGHYRIKLSKSERNHANFAGNSDIFFFSSMGLWSKFKGDVKKEFKVGSRGGVYRRHVKKYIRWRLGIVHWGKKILRFKKNYLFWNYARSLSHYFYKGYFMHSIFNSRIDVYIMRMFGIRTLKFSRLLVRCGHIFRGALSIRNPFDRIYKYDIVSISKKANIYLNKKKYFKYWRTHLNSASKKIQNRVVKSSPLTYCRQHKDLSFYGEIKNVKYYMVFASDHHALNLPTRKTKYFNLNYFHVQKIISTSWW